MAELDFYMHIYGTKDAVNVEELSSADVVERKHGKWIIVDKYSDYRTERCSACGFVANRTYIQDIWSFCPNCGADMRGEE